MKLLFKTFVKVSAVVLSVLGVISWIFPFGEVDKNSIIYRAAALLGFIVVALIISFIRVKALKQKNSIETYKKGKTNIVFRYKNLDELLYECFYKKSTIVVPINTFLPSVGDRDKLINTSIHSQVLVFLQNHGVKIDKSSVAAIDRKNIHMTDGDNCAVGDWFILSLREKGIESDLRFLFLANGRPIEENGKMNNDGATRQDHLMSLQSLCDAIIMQTDTEEEVYIPLLGAGNTNVGKGSDILRILSDVLMFNRANLKQHITVFIDPKNKSENQIVDLQ